MAKFVIDTGKWLLVIAVVAGCFLVGCAALMDKYPATMAPVVKKYIGTEGMKEAGIKVKEDGTVNQLWVNKGQLRNALELAHQQHALTQTEILYMAQKDNIAYSDANAVGMRDYRIAEAEAKTAANIFWTGLGLLLTGGTGLGIGGYVVNSMLKNSMWTETEHNDDVTAKVQTALAELIKTHWSNTEVATEVANRVRSVCAALGITDAAKIEELVKNEVAKAIAEV